MENQEPNIVPVSTPDQSELARQVESLRQVLTSALVLMIVISATLNIYLWRQVKYTRADLQVFRPQATETVSEFEKKTIPMLNQLFAALNEFGRSPRSDATFQSIMRKYGVVNATNAPAPAAPATSPMPAPAKK